MYLLQQYICIYYNGIYTCICYSSIYVLYIMCIYLSGISPQIFYKYKILIILVYKVITKANHIWMNKVSTKLKNIYKLLAIALKL